MLSIRSCNLLAFLCFALVLLNSAKADDSSWDEYLKHRKNHKFVLNRVQDLSLSDDSDNTELTAAVQNSGATCYDHKLSTFINTGLQYYYHDMGALSAYILKQIQSARYSGSWLVHAQMIGSQHQGVEWQSVSNGDLLKTASQHGCYYHDTQTYVIIVRY
ncbi:hypothetical protein Ddc_15091 [Ditylenchus destructor]|nr:hypothetical protein Ddc_15091 [Ditylenchus destructor]